MKRFLHMWFVPKRGLSINERISRRKWKKRLIKMKQYANKMEKKND